MILMKDLNREQEMILLMSRMSMSEAVVNRIDTLIRDKELNWNYILQVCIKNKILGLFWGNIVRLKYVEFPPGYEVSLSWDKEQDGCLYKRS